MSLVTRCTSCGTLFKVVADQLKISDGWVRCGQCSTVFDAQSNLVQASQPSRPAALKQESSASPAYSFDSTHDSVLDANDREALLAAFASAGVVITSPAQITPAQPSIAPNSTNDEEFLSGFVPASAQVLPPPQPAIPSSLSSSAKDAPPSHLPSYPDESSFRPGTLRNSGELDSDAGPSSSSWTASEYPARIAQIAAEAQDSKLTELYTLPGQAQTDDIDIMPPITPQFVQQAQRAARWRSPWIRLGLGLLALLLATGLAIQVALHDKDHLAAQWPNTKPWLDQLCQYAGCQVQALRRIEAITVDASSFNRINKNNAQLEAVTQSYLLGVTLKNTGTLPVALPHIELSLQDAQDQPILRRVLSPADLGSSLQALAPSQDMAGSLTLQVNTAELANRRIQGYRVLAFYP